MKKVFLVFNAMQNLIYGEFRFILSEKQLKNTKTF